MTTLRLQFDWFKKPRSPRGFSRSWKVRIEL